PALPNPMMLNPAPTFNPDIDPALAVYGTDGNLHPIAVQSVLAGVQYYLPVGDGRMWISGNFSRLNSSNAVTYKAAGAATALNNKLFADANLFFDATPALRFGFEYAWTRDSLSDGTFAVNHRYQ